jgi:hypothetical protein
MKRITTLPSGAKMVTNDPTSKAKGAARCKAEEARCFKCRTVIGLETPYHEISTVANGPRVAHVKCCRAI